MKHLRKFNESRESDLEELKDFCEGSLAYLLDDKIDIDYRYHSSHTYFSHIAGTPVNHTKHIYDVRIYSTSTFNSGLINSYRLYSEPTGQDIEWDVIKDYFIPFLDRLSSRYKIHGWEEDIDYVKITYKKLTGLSSMVVSYYDVINDNIDINKIWSLHLKVEI